MHVSQAYDEDIASTAATWIFNAPAAYTAYNSSRTLFIKC